MHPCSRCNFETRHYSKLLSHYRFVHSYEHGFFLTCCTDGCQRQYSNVDSFIKHIKRKHQAFFGIHLRKWSDSNRETGNLINLVEFHDEEHQVFGDELLENSAIDCKVNFSQKLGLFLLNLRERHKLPAVVIPKIVEEFKSMISHHQAQVSQSLLSTLSANDVTENGLIRLREIFQEQSDVELALNHLNSDHKLNKFAKQNLNFIQPIEYKADRTDRDTYQYVPILETLQSLLLKDDVFSHVMHGHQSVDEIMRDYCDGEHFKANPLFQNEPNALQIILFFDEFTAVNPIGHQVKNYKIGGFYMLLGNLPPKYRSQLYMIQLVILCLSPVIKKNGFQKVLEPLIHDLSVLETTGITISKSDGNYTFKGTVAAVVADNLGSHSIGGFLESFTTLRSCRFCFVSKQNMQTILNCDQVTPRTVDMYNEQLKLVERDQNLASVYGLKGCCPLNQLEYFHFIKGSPADLAHDLFEGVVCEVTKNVVAYCVARDFFTLEDLNDRLSSFEFSNVDKGNKPLKVSLNLRNLKIKQSAAQMWCFVRHLPLLVGMWVPDLDPKWEVLLQLRDVLLYVCAPALNRGHILVMKDLIEDFASSYRENFPDETLKPKFHYMIHYPHLMLNYGPLIHLQTIRFEGKHNYFKELVYRTKNKKNLCKSLALRHQYYQCTFNAGPNYLSGSNADSTGGSVVPLCLLKDTYQTLLQPVLHGEQEVFLAKSVTVSGITYRNGTCVVTGLIGFIYTFSRIDHCIVVQGRAYLLCTEMETVEFQRHFHAYAVRSTDQTKLLDVHHLKDPKPLGIYPDHVKKNQQLVVMIYKVLT